MLNYSINRRERRITIGTYPAWSAAAAREEAKRLKRLIDQGVDPLEERNARKTAPKVIDLWDEYQRVHLPTLTDRSARDQRSMWKNYILPELQNQRVADLSGWLQDCVDRCRSHQGLVDDHAEGKRRHRNRSNVRRFRNRR